VLHYDYGYYNLSLDHFNKLIEDNPYNMDLYDWVIYNYSKLGDFDNAKLSFNKAVKFDDQSAKLYSAMGSAYINKTLFLEAVGYLDKAIELDPQNENAYVIKLKALYRGKRNLKCIEFGKESEKVFAASADISWYLGKCHSDLGNYQEAIDYFKKAVELNPKDDESLSSIAYAYLALEDYVHAEEFSAKSLKLYSENSTALYVKEALKERKKPMGQQISKFFYDNYLYKDGMVDLEKKLSVLNKPDISNREINEVIGNAKKKDDIFTFVVYGEQYDYLAGSSDNDIEYKDMGDKIYLKINGFNVNTDDKFIEILDKIPSKDKKSLVIDLRGNSGGLTVTSNNMLDVLLPQYVTSTLIYKDGYTDSYYSDASQLVFKKIYILVDEHSASASELLTLGLKTYLNNVTIVGRNTFGKGVGQRVFEDKKRKIMVFVVNHYWNVKQKNIMQTKIKPDIYIKGNKLEDFMKPVMNGVPK
jgi:tetratricopeptide (TPR) repeat protein